jgi:hypothetical protein
MAAAPVVRRMELFTFCQLPIAACQCRRAVVFPWAFLMQVATPIPHAMARLDAV